MRSTALLPIAALLLLAACGRPDAPRIDGTDAASYRQSLEAVRADLGPGSRAKFEAALKWHEAQAFAKANSRAEYNAILRERLKGKSATDIMASAATGVSGIGDQAADAIFDIKKEATDVVRAVDRAAGGADASAGGGEGGGQ